MISTGFQEISGVIPPPPGVQPNFEHPESLGYRIIIAGVVCWLASTLFVFLSLYTRAKIIRIIAAEDYILLVAWLLSLAHSAVVIGWVKLGAGIHYWDLPITKLGPFVRMDIAEGTFYGASTFCTKLSILLFFLHLSPYDQFRALIYITFVITSVHGLVSIFQFSLSWRPIPKERDLVIAPGSCAAPISACVALAAINMGIDFALFLLPIVMVWNIQLRGQEKRGIILIFTLGSLVCIASIARLTVQTAQ